MLEEQSESSYSTISRDSISSSLSSIRSDEDLREKIRKRNLQKAAKGPHKKRKRGVFDSSLMQQRRLWEIWRRDGDIEIHRVANYGGVHPGRRWIVQGAAYPDWSIIDKLRSANESHVIQYGRSYKRLKSVVVPVVIENKPSMRENTTPQQNGEVAVKTLRSMFPLRERKHMYQHNEVENLIGTHDSRVRNRNPAKEAKAIAQKLTKFVEKKKKKQEQEQKLDELKQRLREEQLALSKMMNQNTESFNSILDSTSERKNEEEEDKEEEEDSVLEEPNADELSQSDDCQEVCSDNNYENEHTFPERIVHKRCHQRVVYFDEQDDLLNLRKRVELSVQIKNIKGGK